jgi:phage-related protein (TIGR01555 family)
MKKVSVRKAAKTALREDSQMRKKVQEKSDLKTFDSIQNFAAAIGVGTGNITSATTYGFNPVTRVRTVLEWVHRGSWLGGVAIDIVADDMTREGIELKGDLKPEEMTKIEERATELAIWPSLNDEIKWARLYGGALGVYLVEGQKPETPLRIQTVGKDQFKGLGVLDRWMVEPSLEDLITELGPMMGLPKYYTVTSSAPFFSGQKIHYSRCIRLEGIRVPYWQRLMENLWGISEIERLWDRMIAFDSATQGAAQLVYKSYLRTVKVKGLRELISAGGQMYQKLIEWVNFMRNQQTLEGMTLIDSEDEFEAHTHSAFSGLSDALLQFAQQIAGALQIPLVRLLGQSPAGLNSSGESDLRTYYDGIKQRQTRHLKIPVTNIYRMIAQSLGILVPDGFGITFRPLWQLTDKDKSDIASQTTETILKVADKGLLSDQIILRELKQISHTTNVWSNISDEDIEKASDTPAPPIDALLPGDESEGEEAGPKPPKNKKAEDAAKQSKQTVEYQSTATGADHCALCEHFEKPNGCTLVEGEIAPEGWCKLYKAANLT